MNVAEVARIWHLAGVSTIPVRTDGTKRPSVRWADYQVEIPVRGELDQWWPNGKSTLGLALICGKVSGNLEMTELEAAAATGATLDRIKNELGVRGFPDVWDKLMASYVEFTPSGGIHFLYRVDGEVPGNTKLARTKDGKVLAETRGEGGYVIVAPTSGLVHPSGESWSKTPASTFGQVAVLSMADRDVLHQAITASLDEAPPEPLPLPVPVGPPPTSTGGNGTRPGDAWAATVTWSDILQPAGWSLSHRHGVEEYWVRPGKAKKDGHSATTNYRGSDLIKVFSSSVPELNPDATYTKFGAYTALHHGGDWKSATQALVSQGYGDLPARPAAKALDTLHTGASTELAVVAQLRQAPSDDTEWTFDEVGTAERLWIVARDRFRYVVEEKIFYHWNGTVWEPDRTGALVREMIRLTEDMMAIARRTDDKELDKWARQCRSHRRIMATIGLLATMPECSVNIAEFNRNENLLNVRNGILDLESELLIPHEPEPMLTRTAGAEHDPDAVAPKFTQFMAEVLPDEELRSYVQRAVGYSLMGTADRRSLFLIHGPSGTGKSAFMEIMSSVFGEYAGVAPAGTFKAGSDKGANNDLHRLRGKRFVTTSETGEHTSFDEDLLKRLTGRDPVSSRGLYQEFQDWVPECAIWIATNHPPKFSSDDDAIWRRAKLIPFLTQFGLGDTPEIPGLGSIIAREEGPGIFNWVLEGLRQYRAMGLAEPDQVQVAATEHRESSDSVLRFYDEMVADGNLVEAPDGFMRTAEMVAAYLKWCQENSERPVGTRRFTLRLKSGRPHLEHAKRKGHMVWGGVVRAQHLGPAGNVFGT